MMVVMRYPEGHKEAMRERIVGAAAKALRRHGVEGVSIPALMKKAGLTHGGFYGYFRGRDELVAAAVMAAAQETEAGVFSEGRSLDDVLDLDLSRGHLERPAAGCVIAALGAEAPRQPAPVRRAFAEAARGLLRLVERRLHPESPPGELSDEALAQTSAMVGAVLLGRLVNDDALADRLLAAARPRRRAEAGPGQ
jgi:TetR/AcrR family transcriptional repressor of nem operon